MPATIIAPAGRMRRGLTSIKALAQCRVLCRCHPPPESPRVESRTGIGRSSKVSSCAVYDPKRRQSPGRQIGRNSRNFGQNGDAGLDWSRYTLKLPPGMGPEERKTTNADCPMIRLPSAWFPSSGSLRHRDLQAQGLGQQVFWLAVRACRCSPVGTTASTSHDRLNRPETIRPIFPAVCGRQDFQLTFFEVGPRAARKGPV